MRNLGQYPEATILSLPLEHKKLSVTPVESCFDAAYVTIIDGYALKPQWSPLR